MGLKQSVKVWTDPTDSEFGPLTVVNTVMNFEVS